MRFAALLEGGHCQCCGSSSCSSSDCASAVVMARAVPFLPLRQTREHRARQGKTDRQCQQYVVTSALKHNTHCISFQTKSSHHTTTIFFPTPPIPLNFSSYIYTSKFCYQNQKSPSSECRVLSHPTKFSPYPTVYTKIRSVTTTKVAILMCTYKISTHKGVTRFHEVDWTMWGGVWVRSGAQPTTQKKNEIFLLKWGFSTFRVSWSVHCFDVIHLMSTYCCKPILLQKLVNTYSPLACTDKLQANQKLDGLS